MQGFSRHYNACNPGIFEDSETAFVLAYSVIMLNTDAHSPHVRRRMTLDDWIRNNRELDNGKDLPRAMLEGIFHRITFNEIRLQQPDQGAATPVP
jgi:brefeldin A-inhibited guanine nucleotide-exchange protein